MKASLNHQNPLRMFLLALGMLAGVGLTGCQVETGGQTLPSLVSDLLDHQLALGEYDKFRTQRLAEEASAPDEFDDGHEQQPHCRLPPPRAVSF